MFNLSSRPVCLLAASSRSALSLVGASHLGTTEEKTTSLFLLLIFNNLEFVVLLVVDHLARW